MDTPTDAEPTNNDPPVQRDLDGNVLPKIVVARPPIQNVTKVADRPHWITIAVGCLAPSLAIIALIVSLEGLRTSRESLRIGQRAYVQGRFTWQEDTPSLMKKNGVTFWRLRVELANTGNSPAWIDGLVTSADCGNPSSRLRKCPDAISLYDGTSGQNTVGGKDKNVVEIGNLLCEKAMIADSHYSTIVLPPVTVQFSYRDVFGDVHKSNTKCEFGFSDEKPYEGKCSTAGD